MKIVSLEQLPSVAMTMEGAHLVSKQVPVGKEDGAPNFSFRVFTLEPGGHTPYHQHDAEHLNYILQGEGALVDEDGHENPVSAGDFGFVAPQEKHQFRNKSNDALFKFICAVPQAFE